MIGIAALSASASYAFRRSWLSSPTISQQTLIGVFDHNIDAVAARGMDAKLIDPYDLTPVPAAQYVALWMDRCASAIDALGLGQAIGELQQVLRRDSPATAVRRVFYAAKAEAIGRGLASEDATDFATRRLIQWTWTSADGGPSSLLRSIEPIAANNGEPYGRRDFEDSLAGERADHEVHELAS